MDGEDKPSEMDMGSVIFRRTDIGRSARWAETHRFPFELVSSVVVLVARADTIDSGKDEAEASLGMTEDGFSL